MECANERQIVRDRSAPPGEYSDRVTARVALATCAEFPEGEPIDGALLAGACASAGITAAYVDWASPGVDWSAFDLVVIRSTWDYAPVLEQFLGWARRVPRLANPASVISWNSSKTYLGELIDKGVPTVPTAFVEPGAAAQLPADGEFVVKPATGAGSLGVGRFDSADSAARRHIGALHDAGRVAMVQPYLGAVDERGETSLIFIGGRYSHAIRKGPMLPGGRVHPLTMAERDELFVAEQIVRREPEEAEHEVARAALEVIPGGADLLYARVDLLPSDRGPLVGELELIEPSLFLRFGDGAAARLADAIRTEIDTWPGPNR